MAYLECQTALKSKLLTLTTQFPSSSQVTLADYSVLDSGITHAAVLLPAAIGAGRNTGGTYQRLWDILIDLFQAYTTQSESFSNFEILRAAVILAIDNDPNLGGTNGVTDAILVSDGDIQSVTRNSPQNNGPVFLTQRLRVTVYQDLVAA